MKLTSSLLFTCFLISINSQVFSQSININTAKDIAKNHLVSVGRNNLKSASPNQAKIQFSALSVTSESKDTLYFVLNDTINHSFVIVAADKRSVPIIGYSLESNYNENNQPPAFVAWMENRKQEIADIKKNNLKPDSAITANWNNLSSANSVIEISEVEPLIQTHWNQGRYYNSLCPSDAAGSGGHVHTGCTITAMAQIMKYWNYPTKGTGSHSYSHPTYGNLSADFGSTTYQWSQMPNQVISQNDAVATLMFHCGVSLETDYGPSGSGASDPRDELVQYFNYSSNAMLVYRNGLTTSEWSNMLKSELDLRHPIWYTGNSLVGPGHAFICDGYQDADYFHFNWGWGGSSDGYFYIGNLNPVVYNFNEYQSALINILPGSLPDGYTGFFLSSNALDICTKGGTTSVDVCSSASWTASSNQSWLSLSTNTGVSGKTTLTLTATENQTRSDRSATVTISAVGFCNQSITVSQYMMNVTPGGLRNLIQKNATTITKLTLTGTIDARDFKTMRDAMPSLTDIDLSDVTIVEYIGIGGTINSIFSLTYPANAIPDQAFHVSNKSKGLVTITIPSSVISIGSNAFLNCSELTTVFIPSSVTSIRNGAFIDCSALITVDTNNLNYSSIDGILLNKTQTKLIQCPTSKTGIYTIASSVTSIGSGAFSNCSGLTSVTIPSSVTSIESCAFNGCSGLTSVIIPSSVTFIKSSAFNGCKGLTSVTIPSSVISIEYATFYGCSNLSSIFAYSISPVNLTFSTCVFDMVDKNTCILYIPYSSKAAYQAADQWKDFKNMVEMPGIFLSKSTIGMDSNADTAQIAISSSSDWTATSDQTWLTISPLAGIAGSNTITFAAIANPSPANRVATVTILATGIASQTIKVTQYDKVEVTAGRLKTILAGQLSDIKCLTLTGTIDARDFKTMCDEMPMLTDIDLSGATIAAYTGTEGPEGIYNNFYPAKGVPNYAFCNHGTLQGKIGLGSVLLPASVTSIGYSAFQNCKGLTSATKKTTLFVIFA